MSTVNTPYDGPVLDDHAIARDARELLGQVMAFVAVTVGFTSLGAYLGRDLSGATGPGAVRRRICLHLRAHVAAARAASNSRSDCCSGWASCSDSPLPP